MCWIHYNRCIIYSYTKKLFRILVQVRITRKWASIYQKYQKTYYIGHEIWLRIFSEFVFLAPLKWGVSRRKWVIKRRLARSPRIGHSAKFTQERCALANARPNTDFALKIDQTKIWKWQNLPADDQSHLPTHWTNF